MKTALCYSCIIWRMQDLNIAEIGAEWLWLIEKLIFDKIISITRLALGKGHIKEVV